MANRRTNKKNRLVKRFRIRHTNEASADKKIQDVALIDIVLKKLYNNGDKNTASLEEDILKPNKIQFTEEGSNRLWDILMSTNLVSPVIGFKRSGRIAITSEGYKLMSNFGSYQNFIEQREQQAKQPAAKGIPIPQFILTTAAEKEIEEVKEKPEPKNS